MYIRLVSRSLRPGHWDEFESYYRDRYVPGTRDTKGLHRFAARAGAAYRVHGDWFLHGPRVRVTDAEDGLVAEAVTGPRER